MARQLLSLLMWPSGGQNGTVNATMYDAVTQSPAGRASGQSTIASSEGPALHFAGTTRSSTATAMRVGGTWGAGPGFTYDSRFGTVIARMRLTTVPATLCYAVHLSNSAGTRGPAVGFDSSGHAVAGENGTNGMTAGSFKADATVWTNQWVTVGGSNRYVDLGTPYTTAPACAARLWVNGVKIGDATGNGGDANTGSAPTIFLGREGQNYDNFFTGDIAWAAIFSRFLSDDEHEWWAKRPFDVLEQQANVSFFSLPSATAAFVAAQQPLILQAVNRAGTY